VRAFARTLQEFDVVRDLMASASVTTLVDLPFTLMVLAVIGMKGGPLVFVPLLGMVLRALTDIMRLPSQRPEDNSRTRLPDFRGDILFERVNFCWPNQTYRALHGINLKIRAAKRWRSQGGPTQDRAHCCALLRACTTRTAAPFVWTALDLRQVHPADLRSATSCCLQDPGLVAGSLKDNIILGCCQVDDTQVLRTARCCGHPGWQA